jgi:hypothetical protein
MCPSAADLLTVHSFIPVDLLAVAIGSSILATGSDPVASTALATALEQHRGAFSWALGVTLICTG